MKTTKNKFSKNAKLNGLLSEMYDSLLSFCDTEQESRIEIQRYKKKYKNHAGGGMCQDGCLLVYYSDVRDLYKRHNYKTLAKYSDAKLWELYKAQNNYLIYEYF